MSLQMRLSQSDARLYSANRDVAHCFAPVVKEVAARLEDNRWPAVGQYLTDLGVSDAALGEACVAFVYFVRSAVDYPKESMADALARCGWYKLPEAAQVAYMAYLGTVVSGIFFHGVREVTINGEGPCSTMGDLVAAGERAHRLLTIPRWRRPWFRAWALLRRICRVVRNGFSA